MKPYCGVIITFAVISFLLLRASFQTGANDNSSELMMGKNENNAFNAEPCDRDYYGLGESNHATKFYFDERDILIWKSRTGKKLIFFLTNFDPKDNCN